MAVLTQLARESDVAKKLTTRHRGGGVVCVCVWGVWKGDYGTRMGTYVDRSDWRVSSV
jgi:hypothetical protein